MAVMADSLDFSSRAGETRGDYLRSGQTLLGRYRLERLVGRGGMGVVWLADDQRLHRPVALKFLLDLLVHDRVAVDELKEETNRCLDLTHPHIVRIYDFIEGEGLAGIVMEYVAGESLAVLRSKQPGKCFEHDALHGWIEHLVKALDYAHREARVVHRDLKPANLMLSGSGALKVSDFGISRSLNDSLTRISGAAKVSGTLGYMSPQQAQGAAPSPSDDIYAIGATLFELLTGKPPFHGQPALVFQQLINVPAPTVTQRRRDFGLQGLAPLPMAWEQTIAACLSKEPEDRPQSMQEVGNLLLERTPASATTSVTLPVSDTAQAAFVPPLPRRRSRFPVYAAVFGVLALIGAGVGAWMAWPEGAKSAGSRDVAAKDSGIPKAESPALISTGTLRVRTEPQGALVSLDGENWKRSSDASDVVEFADLQPGFQTIWVKQPGYALRKVEYRVEASAQPQTETVKLEREAGSLEIHSEPEGCTFVLRQVRASTGQPDATVAELRGTTPGSFDALPTGDYKLTFSREGWPDESKTVSIAAGQPANTAHKFEPALVSVKCNVVSSLTLDGNVIGSSPISFEVPPGKHQLIADADGYVTQTIEIDAKPGEPVPIAVSFEPIQAPPKTKPTAKNSSSSSKKDSGTRSTRPATPRPQTRTAERQPPSRSAATPVPSRSSTEQAEAEKKRKDAIMRRAMEKLRGPPFRH